jgi:hypothetical protein
LYAEILQKRNHFLKIQDESLAIIHPSFNEAGVERIF